MSNGASVESLFGWSDELEIGVKTLREDVVLPKYETAGAAAMDLRAWWADKPPVSRYACSTEEETGFVPESLCHDDGKLVLRHGDRVKIGTGLAFEIPEGYEGQVRSRSGKTLKDGLHVGLGTVDSDYRGEVGVIIVNLGGRVTISKGDRIAQIVFAPVMRAKLKVVKELSETARGAGGFGSTGNK